VRGGSVTVQERHLPVVTRTTYGALAASTSRESGCGQSGGDPSGRLSNRSTLTGLPSGPVQSAKPKFSSVVKPFAWCSSSCGCWGKRRSRTLKDGQAQPHTSVTATCGSDSWTRAAAGCSTDASRERTPRCHSFSGRSMARTLVAATRSFANGTSVRLCRPGLTAAGAATRRPATAVSAPSVAFAAATGPSSPSRARGRRR